MHERIRATLPSMHPMEVEVGEFGTVWSCCFATTNGNDGDSKARGVPAAAAERNVYAYGPTWGGEGIAGSAEVKAASFRASWRA